MRVTEPEVVIAGSSGAVVYRDTLDHFDNALLRLMKIDRSRFESWVVAADAAGQGGDLALTERLATGWRAIAPLPGRDGAPRDGQACSNAFGDPGRVLFPSIAESPAFGIATSLDGSLGWLIRADDDQARQVLDPPEYEEEYFEGDPTQAGGYGNYADQSGWRLEKAHRQVGELSSATGLGEGRVLDLGAGYGFFQVALRDHGFTADGIEISAFARDYARHAFDLEILDGVLSDHVGALEGRYDAVTGFDFVEHLPDVPAMFAEVRRVLRPGGFLGLKTPNLDCPEREVFGPWYHSLKREHLWYFTPASLTALAAQSGFEAVSVTTSSHLLAGFVGEEVVAEWARSGRGADITAWYRAG